MTAFPSERTREYLNSANQSSNGSYSTHSESYNTETASPVSDEITRTSPGDTLQNNGVLVDANPPHQNGISLFQGYCFLYIQSLLFDKLVAKTSWSVKFLPGLLP